MNKTYKIVQIEPSLFQVLSCNGVEWYWEDAWREFQGHLNECETYIRLKQKE